MECRRLDGISKALDQLRINFFCGKRKSVGEPLMPVFGMLEVEMDIEKLKRCKSSDCGQIPAKLVEGGGRTVCSEVDNLSLFVVRKKYLDSGRCQSLYLCV